MFDIRRRLLLCCGIKDFIIFLNGSLTGDIINSSFSEVSSVINIKGGETTQTGRQAFPGDYEYNGLTGSEAIYAWAAAAGHQNVRVYANGDGFICEWSSTRRVGGSLTIGTYDFKKYKTLKFTVSDYSGKGTLTVENLTKEINANGDYSVDIKALKGTYDLKFSSDSVSGYSVNNVYLEG